MFMYYYTYLVLKRVLIVKKTDCLKYIYLISIITYYNETLYRNISFTKQKNRCLLIYTSNQNLIIIDNINIILIHISKIGEVQMEKLLTNKKFSQNIKKIRMQKNLTQEQTVAKLQLLGSPISRSTYSLIEMGRGNIFISDLVGLQQIFCVDFKEFFDGITVQRESRENK